MALSPKDQDRIIEEEKLRFKVRQDLHAQSCAHNPRRGRWAWVLALMVLGWVLWHHSRCERYCDMDPHAMMMGSCMHHGLMAPPLDGQDGMVPPAPGDDGAKAVPKK